MKYKNIKGVAHNLGHRFLSDTNTTTRGAEAIVPERLFATAVAARIERIAIDFITGQVAPDAVRSRELDTAVQYYAETLPRMLEQQNVSPDAVVGARMTIELDYTRSRHARYEPAESIPEFTCTVELMDDHGVRHIGTPSNWWRV